MRFNDAVERRSIFCSTVRPAPPGRFAVVVVVVVVSMVEGIPSFLRI
jgi:hypothetical protein